VTKENRTRHGSFRQRSALFCHNRRHDGTPSKAGNFRHPEFTELKMKISTLLRQAALASAIGAAALAPASALAGSKHHHHGGGYNGGYYGGYNGGGAFVAGLAGGLLGAALFAPPIYAAPVYGAPVYVEPAPIYVQPAPIYVEPAPVYVDPYPTGSAFAPGRRPYSDYPAPSPRVVTYDEAVGGYEPWSQAWLDYCSAKFRSFDRRTGTYLGYDGKRHFCAGR
jgi:hypothetical protein